MAQLNITLLIPSRSCLFKKLSKYNMFYQLTYPYSLNQTISTRYLISVAKVLPLSQNLANNHLDGSLNRRQPRQSDSIVGTILFILRVRLQTNNGYRLLIRPIHPVHSHNTASLILQIRLPNAFPIALVNSSISCVLRPGCLGLSDKSFNALPHFLQRDVSFLLMVPERYSLCNFDHKSSISGMPILIRNCISLSLRNRNIDRL